MVTLFATNFAKVYVSNKCLRLWSLNLCFTDFTVLPNLDAITSQSSFVVGLSFIISCFSCSSSSGVHNFLLLSSSSSPCFLRLPAFAVFLSVSFLPLLLFFFLSCPVFSSFLCPSLLVFLWGLRSFLPGPALFFPLVVFPFLRFLVCCSLPAAAFSRLCLSFVLGFCPFVIIWYPLFVVFALRCLISFYFFCL